MGQRESQRKGLCEKLGTVRDDGTSHQRFLIFFLNQSTEILVNEECCINANFIHLCLPSAGVQVNHSRGAMWEWGAE